MRMFMIPSVRSHGMACTGWGFGSYCVVLGAAPVRLGGRREARAARRLAGRGAVGW